MNIRNAVQLFAAVLVIVAYSIALFVIGTKFERTQLNSSIAERNRLYLEQNAKDNAELLQRQRMIVEMMCRMVREKKWELPLECK